MCPYLKKDTTQPSRSSLYLFLRQVLQYLLVQGRSIVPLCLVCRCDTTLHLIVAIKILNTNIIDV